MPEASRLEEELTSNFEHIDITLTPSSGGDFRVLINEQLIFDKLSLPKSQRRFPDAMEITNIIKQL